VDGAGLDGSQPSAIGVRQGGAGRGLEAVCDGDVLGGGA
jgi:hypothetical protein